MEKDDKRKDKRAKMKLAKIEKCERAFVAG